MEVARLIGLEGRVDKDNFVIEKRVLYIYLPATSSLRWNKELAPTTACDIDIIKYEFDLVADDGTLIYKRTTPPWK
jgi:hypothetical protein